MVPVFTLRIYYSHTLYDKMITDFNFIADEEKTRGVTL